jgi:hypothetical protein
MMNGDVGAREQKIAVVEQKNIIDTRNIYVGGQGTNYSDDGTKNKLWEER